MNHQITIETQITSELNKSDNQNHLAIVKVLGSIVMFLTSK